MLLNAQGAPIAPTINAPSHPIAALIHGICTELAAVASREDTPARRIQGIGETIAYLSMAGMLIAAPGLPELDADVGDFCDAVDRIISLQSDMAKISRPEIADNMRRFNEGLSQVTKCRGFVAPLCHNSPNASRPVPVRLWAEIAARAAGYVVSANLQRQPLPVEALAFLSRVTTHVAWMCGE
jgi:hypothetical protein